MKRNIFLLILAATLSLFISCVIPSGPKTGLRGKFNFVQKENSISIENAGKGTVSGNFDTKLSCKKETPLQFNGKFENGFLSLKVSDSNENEIYSGNSKSDIYSGESFGFSINIPEDGEYILEYSFEKFQGQINCKW